MINKIEQLLINYPELIALSWFVSAFVLCFIATYLLDRFYYPKMFARRRKSEFNKVDLHG